MSPPRRPRPTGWSSSAAVALVLVLVALAVLAGCGEADDTSDAARGDTGGVPMSTSTSTAVDPTVAAPTTVPSTSTSTSTSATEAETTTTVLADPCHPRGYVQRDGRPVPTGAEHAAIDTSGLTGPPGRVYETESLVLGGGEGAPRSFDWDADGVADQVAMNASGGTVSVITGSGTVTVSGVRTDFSDVDHYSSIHRAMPLDVGDVTGDGNLDLLVASRGSVAVLVGRGAATGPLTVPFDRIGLDVAGWVTPPWQHDERADGLIVSWPSQTAEPVVFHDVDGDGLDDIGVYNHQSRSIGPFLLLLGQPCPPS